MTKSMMSGTHVNDANHVPTSALAYSMNQAIETLNSKNVLEFAKSTATSSSAGYCAFKYPTGFSKDNTLLLCIRYINDSSRPIVEHRDADFWGGDFSVSNMSIQSGKEVTAFLAKII